jgi:hypothetical protein
MGLLIWNTMSTAKGKTKKFPAMTPITVSYKYSVQVYLHIHNHSKVFINFYLSIMVKIHSGGFGLRKATAYDYNSNRKFEPYSFPLVFRRHFLSIVKHHDFLYTA